MRETVVALEVNKVILMSQIGVVLACEFLHHDHMNNDYIDYWLSFTKVNNNSCIVT